MPQPMVTLAAWSSTFTPSSGGHSGLREQKGIVVFQELRAIQPIPDKRSSFRTRGGVGGALGPALWQESPATRPRQGPHSLLSVRVVNTQIWQCACSGRLGRPRALAAPPAPQPSGRGLPLTADPPSSALPRQLGRFMVIPCARPATKTCSYTPETGPGRCPPSLPLPKRAWNRSAPRGELGHTLRARLLVAAGTSPHGPRAPHRLPEGTSETLWSLALVTQMKMWRPRGWGEQCWQGRNSKPLGSGGRVSFCRSPPPPAGRGSSGLGGERDGRFTRGRNRWHSCLLFSSHHLPEQETSRKGGGF